ncbi:MAG: FKBP-type peptidyl-prolyl cis-trans isomerase [Planctomycetaceae bacterium]|jgi:FKBP-type peptidyl-prolyl cis-trans isomerase FkpA|nr:FKBP-type peptidyl-prolyl cis-trans isomerase [Planctomycetaceae bacterium]MDG2390511.1 FKBP-type peptidyl-prolyl cis-trans isomerase [Planctomycetaceae bacterium]
MIRQCFAVFLLTLLISGCGGDTTQIDYSKEGPNGPNAQEEFSQTESGLQYRILREGSGASPDVYDKVSVSYRGWLDDDSQFDSSYPRKSPIEFGLNQVIPGWTEGMQLVKEGGKIELLIPSELGYGPGGSPPVIPPNAQLHFIVELHEVK